MFKNLDVKEVLKSGYIATGTSGSGKTYLSFHVAKKLSKTKLNGRDIIVMVFDSSKAWQKLSHIDYVIDVNEMCTNNKTFKFFMQDTIFDISGLTYPERIRFVDRICEYLLKLRKKTLLPTSPYIFVIFEEAQMYFYQGSMRSPKKTPNCIELITVGRNFGLRYGAITQFPSMIDKLLIKMTKQRYFGWTSETNDVDYIESIIGSEWGDELKKLMEREFIYSYPTRTNTEPMKIIIPEWSKNGKPNKPEWNYKIEIDDLERQPITVKTQWMT